jgi:hypothetical protein
MTEVGDGKLTLLAFVCRLGEMRGRQRPAAVGAGLLQQRLTAAASPVGAELFLYQFAQGMGFQEGQVA